MLRHLEETRKTLARCVSVGFFIPMVIALENGAIMHASARRGILQADRLVKCGFVSGSTDFDQATQMVRKVSNDGKYSFYQTHGGGDLPRALSDSKRQCLATSATGQLVLPRRTRYVTATVMLWKA